MILARCRASEFQFRIGLPILLLIWILYELTGLRLPYNILEPNLEFKLQGFIHLQLS